MLAYNYNKYIALIVFLSTSIILIDNLKLITRNIACLWSPMLMVVLVFPMVHERSVPPTCCATGEAPPPPPPPSVPPISSTETGAHFSHCSQLTHAKTWLRTVSSCTAEEVPWAPSVCSISSRKDG